MRTRRLGRVAPSNGGAYAGALALASSARGCVLLVRDLLHPLDDLAVQVLLDSEVGHGGRGGGAMPVPFARWNPDHVAGPDLLDRADLDLHPADAGGHNERLSARMRVPCCARAGLERDVGARRLRRVLRLEQRIDAHRSREVLGGSLLRSLRACAGDGERNDRCRSDHGHVLCSGSRVQSSLSGVTGSSRMRLPVAWKIAPVIADATPTIAISP